jgi:hypothetical protein
VGGAGGAALARAPGALGLSAHPVLTLLLDKAVPEGTVLPPEEILLLKDEALRSLTAQMHLAPFETDAPGL